jgi:hypothetical protein
LRDVLDHRHALEADRLEVRRELGESMRTALAELDAQLAQCARHARALEQRTGRREQDANLAFRQAFERLDALAGDLHVGLGLTEPFARRIERERRVLEESAEVGEPAFGLGDGLGGDDEEPVLEPAGERREHGRIGRAGEAADRASLARRGEGVVEPDEGGKELDRVEQRKQCHSCV